ncbi:MAG: Asp/Glu racemase [Amylibacter sp.]|nr:Asp/Glu racemase [Amylibacter sp.]MDG2157607.1 Asp/Glu racemase [Amylibacter sp.]|tara:strand:- start:49 stop:780 length:732 start_codon:yes stop_codon:yes gene_type:complete
MSFFSYKLEENYNPSMGLVVLQADQRIELDARQQFDPKVNLHISRIPSAETVSTDTLKQMEKDLPIAVSLLPNAVDFDVVGYGCTSGTSVIGAENIAKIVKDRCKTKHVTEPVSALIAACRHLGIERIGFLSPYVEAVSTGLRETLFLSGVETPIFGSFNEEIEERVVKISTVSISDAAVELGRQDVDAIFLSCTNLNTLPVIKSIEEKIRKPVLSSNQVLAWHMSQLSNGGLSKSCEGYLFK